MVRKDKRKEHFLDKIPNIQFYTVNITEYYSGKYKKMQTNFIMPVFPNFYSVGGCNNYQRHFCTVCEGMLQ